MRRTIALLMVALLVGCAEDSAYLPKVVARGEVTLRYRHGFQAWAGGQRIARGILWKGLESYVGCVPTARQHAAAAEAAGERALGFSIEAGILGGLAIVGIAGVADDAHRWAWLGGGLGSAVLGAVFAGVSRLQRNAANGHAVDAINYYNDRVGSLGATCADLTYPRPTSAPPAPPQTAPPSVPDPSNSE